ncbi:MAG TPA: dephospho-CoA kinase [Micromonosporaceae bacterium]|nr:dephospho-CoA kinase [Micromonosporaceae bacterium]
MLRVGLTGGIGSGKSEAAARFAELGAVVIDSDRLAREVVAPGSDGLAEVVSAFGPGVVTTGGVLDRPALGRLVFGDEAARRRLEAIIHPRVRARAEALTLAAPPDAVVVNDVPLLVEAGLAPAYHLVVVVQAAETVRVDRLARGRAMVEAEAWARIRAQASDEQRAAVADVVLANDGSPAELAGRVRALWTDRLVPYERNVRLRRPDPPTKLAIVPYDPSWPAQFARVAARVTRAVGPTALRVDHVGSTAVPGLAAKDVIDAQLVVASIEDADAAAEALAGAGFPRYPGQWVDNPKPDAPDPAAWTKRLHGGADPGRPVNLHVRAAGSPAVRYALLMRDYLRAVPAERDGYAGMKRELAGRIRSRPEYTQAKEPWFDAVWSRMTAWAGRTGWTPPA